MVQIKTLLEANIFYGITVEPLLSGHPRGTGKWPLNRVRQKLSLSLFKTLRYF